ncbi:MAG: FUSC family protein [Solirubrobacteraceae bacterium]
MSRLRPHDPGLFALRNAVRAALVTTVAFFLGDVVIGNADIALFAAFGALALLVFVDFDGPPAARLAAFTGLGLAGCAFIAIGTLVSGDPALAGATMAVVGFLVLFAGIVNGYLAAATMSVLLTFILPSMVPAGADAIGERLAGWGLACALAIPAAMLLWAARPPDQLRAAVAAACRALADLVAEPGPERRRAAAERCRAMHERFTATPYRPTGPTGSAGALAALIDDLDWLHGRLGRPAAATARLEPTPSERRLRATTAAVLRASADELVGGATAPPDEQALSRDRTQVARELLERIRDPAVLADDDRLWGALVSTWDVRVASYAAVRAAALARIASPAPAPGRGPSWTRFARRQSIVTAATTRLAAAHASVRSIWFRNSVRGAAGLTIAVLVAQLATLQHAFWVVLGTLSVLRSSALNTSATIVQALAGSTIGIVAGGLLLVAIGTDRALLWAVLPVSILVAAYAPRAISFAAGQAAFTVTVMVLFNLIVPAGWKVGLVRIEDVSIGFAISLVVGLLFWPRGAAALLRRSVAAAFAQAADYATAAFVRLFEDGPGTPVQTLAEAADAAGDRLDAAFRQRLAERAGPDLPIGPVSQLVASAVRIRQTAAALEFLADHVQGAPRPTAATDRLTREARAEGAWYDAFAAALAQDAALPAPRDDAGDVAARAATLEAVRAVAGGDDHWAAVAAVTTVWGALHLDRLRRHEPIVLDAAARLPARPRARGVGRAFGRVPREAPQRG